MREFAYDDAGRMKQVKRDGVVAMNYLYNARGERVYRSGSGETVHTVYDEAGHWLGDYDAAGNALQQALWLDDLPVGLLVGAGASQKLYYLEPDALGSPRVAIDPDRDVAVWRWDLTGEAFGNSTPNEDPDADGIKLTLDMRFPGQRYDAATELVYNYFRDYDPATGRYAQSDPIGLNGGVSTYQYANLGPFTISDPFGLKGLKDLSAGAGLIDASRRALESMMSDSPLSQQQKEDLDRGCIGLTSTYQGLNEEFPENAPKTKCFATIDAALRYANGKNCVKSFVFGKQGVWRHGPPVIRRDLVVPNDSISGAGGHYNYIIYFQRTATYAWMNHSNETPNQRAVLSMEPLTSNSYPNEIWCVTCR